MRRLAQRLPSFRQDTRISQLPAAGNDQSLCVRVSGVRKAASEQDVRSGAIAPTEVPMPTTDEGALRGRAWPRSTAPSSRPRCSSRSAWSAWAVQSRRAGLHGCRGPGALRADAPRHAAPGERRDAEGRGRGMRKTAVCRCSGLQPTTIAPYAGRDRTSNRRSGGTPCLVTIIHQAV